MFAWEIRDRLLMDGMPANKVKFLYDLFDHLTLRRNLFTSKVDILYLNFFAILYLTFSYKPTYHLRLKETV